MSEQYQQPASMLEIRPRFLFLAFILFFFKPYYSINRSQPVIGQWKQNSVPVPPGRYEVAVWVSYPLRPQMGLNTVVVDVPAGASAVISWRAPFTIFGTGKMAIEGVGPITGDPQQAQYGQAQYGQAQYGQAQYGQAQYGQAQYGQAQYGQAQYGQAQYGQAQQPQQAAHQQPVQQAQPVQAAQPVQPAQPVHHAASAPGGWHPDPTGRHQVRYFDGTRWTEHVSDAGTQASDPIS